MRKCEGLVLACVMTTLLACGGVSGPVEPESEVRGAGSALVSRSSRWADGPVLESDTRQLGVAALDMVAALDFPAGLVTSALLTSPHSEAAMVRTSWGPIRPTRGNSMVVLSTGRIGSFAEPGTDFSPLGAEGDKASLRVTLRVPPGVSHLAFRYNFLSAEAPEFVGSEYTDAFVVRVTDADGTRELTRASVNESWLFAVSSTRAGGTGFDLFADDPGGIDHFPVTYPPDVSLYPDAAMTGFVSAHARIRGGGPVTLEFEVRDEYDGFMDSAVVLDDVQLLSLSVVDPNPDLLNDGEVTTNPDSLALGGTPVSAVAADGVTQVLLRIQVPGPGFVQFALPGLDASVHGSLSPPGGTWHDAVTARVVQTGAGTHHAFVLYKAPEDFNSDPSGPLTWQSQREVKIAVRYLADDRSGFLIEQSLRVIRPPVVVVPEIWTSCEAWRLLPDGLFSDPRFQVVCADFSDSNSERLESELNQEVVPRAVLVSLARMRLASVAVAQVDVVAHGAGGLLVRQYVESSAYATQGSFRQGTINRFISLNTPHLGARIADEILVMRAALLSGGPDMRKRWESMRMVLQRVGVSIDPRSVVDSLYATSPFIQRMGRTDVPSHVMMSRGGQALFRSDSSRILFSPMRILYTQMEFNHPHASAYSPPLVNLILGPDSIIFAGVETDLFLTEAEQLGGLSSSSTAVSVFELAREHSETEHFKIPMDPAHHGRIIELLNRSVTSAWFAPSLPSPSSVQRGLHAPDAASAR